MRNILATIVTLLSLYTYSQEPFYKIKYKMDMENLVNYIVADGKPQSTVQMFKMVAAESEKVNLELLISNSTSYFKEIERLNLNNDSDEYYMTMIRGFSYEGSWFYDVLKKDLIFIREYQNKKFYVRKNKLSINWKITSEKKTILGYNCVKATYIRKVPRGDVKITAWFTNEIPLPFGPANYSGQLPGLILELEEVNATYTATKVEKQKKFIIKAPDEKDIISEEAYKKEGNKVMDFYKKVN